jgi:hypothetical protein
MNPQNVMGNELAEVLRRVALTYPEVEEGASCTKKSFKARGKAFLYVGVAGGSYNAMLKLRDSQAEAIKLAGKDSRFKVGAQGWVTATFREDDAPPSGLFERWIDESYRLLVDKKLVATLPERGALGEKKKSAPKKTTTGVSSKLFPSPTRKSRGAG